MHGLHTYLTIISLILPIVTIIYETKSYTFIDKLVSQFIFIIQIGFLMSSSLFKTNFARGESFLLVSSRYSAEL